MPYDRYELAKVRKKKGECFQMRTPNWTPPLSEVTGQKTVYMDKVSAKGTSYTAEVIPSWKLIAIGSPTEKKDREGNVSGYSYEVYDATQDLGGFTITAPEKVKVNGMTNVIFKQVRGGALSSRSTGWFKAESVEVVQ